MEFEKKLGDAPESNIRFWLIVILVIVAAIIAVLTLFLFYTKTCTDETCFRNALVNCQRVAFAREDNGAAWNYIILGKDDVSSCKVNVRLLKINSGSIDAEPLVGEEMVCSVVRNEDQFPESDMQRCSGKLKEDIQEIIIERMHNYLLKNIGQIQQDFNKI